MPSAFRHQLRIESAPDAEFLARLVKTLTVGAVLVAVSYFTLVYLVARGR
jgi:hypothetical protein